MGCAQSEPHHRSDHRHGRLRRDVGRVLDRRRLRQDAAAGSTTSPRRSFGDAFIPGIWAPGPSNFYDGKRIGVPYSADAYGIWYRTDLFEQCGIDANWETWDDYIARLDTLKTCLAGTDVAPMVHYFGQIEQPAALFLGMYDGYMVTKDGKYGLDREKAVAALNKMQSLLPYNPEGALGFDINAGNAVFLNGKAATMVGWPSFIRADADNPEKSQVVGKWAHGQLPRPGLPHGQRLEHVHLPGHQEPGRRVGVDQGLRQPGKRHQVDGRIWHRLALQGHLRGPELVKNFAHFYPAQAANLNKAKSLPWTFAAFEAFFRNEGDFHQGKVTAEEMLDNVQKAWDEIPSRPRWSSWPPRRACRRNRNEWRVAWCVVLL